MNRFLFALLCAAWFLTLGGCALVSNEHLYSTVESTHDHVKLAVSPRYRSIAVVPFFNESGKTTAGMYARRAFYCTLAGYKNYTLKPLKETDAILAQLPFSTIDLKESTSLGKHLKTDLIAFGWVYDQRHYNGLILNRSAVNARVVFVDAKTGDIVFDAQDTRSRTLVGFSLFTMIDDEYMWAREVCNRYDELFRDMMPELPDMILKNSPTPQ